MYSVLRLRIVEYYEEVRRALDSDVETLILERQDNQDVIDDLNQRRDSQIKFLKQEEDDALNRANQASSSTCNEQEIIKWCYFTIPVRINKICLIRCDVSLSPEQIATYRQFLITSVKGGESLKRPTQVPKLLEVFHVKFHHLVSNHGIFIEDCTWLVIGNRTVITLDSSSPPLFVIRKLPVAVTLGYFYRFIEEFIDSPSARFILKHTKLVQYRIRIKRELPTDYLQNTLSILTQLDKIFYTFKQTVCYAGKLTPPRIHMQIDHDDCQSVSRHSHEHLRAINFASLPPDYKYQTVSTFDFDSTEKELNLLNYLFGKMDNLHLLRVSIWAHSDLFKPLIILPDNSVADIHLELYCAQVPLKKVTRRIDIQNTLSSIKDSIKELGVNSIFKDVNLEIINTKSLLDLCRVDYIGISFMNNIKTDYTEGEEQLSVLSFQQLQKLASCCKGGSASENLSEYSNRFILKIDRSIVSE